jgi:hypothetical protein
LGSESKNGWVSEWRVVLLLGGGCCRGVVRSVSHTVGGVKSRLAGEAGRAVGQAFIGKGKKNNTSGSIHFKPLHSVQHLGS